MTLKIQSRAGLSQTGSHGGAKAAVTAASLAPRAHTELAADLDAWAAKDDGRSHAGKTAAADAVADDAPSTIPDFSLALGSWGVGYVNLVSFEDREFSYMIAGPREQGVLTVIEQGAAASTVKSSMLTDAFMSNILYWGTGQAHSIGDVLSRNGITTFRMNGDTSYTAKGAADIFGAGGAEMLVGSAERDIIRGAGGNDSIMGRSGNDIAWGGAGNDQLMGHDGADQLWGGVGVDVLDGGEGADFLMAGSGADKLFGGEGDDALLGGTNADTLLGGDGNDLLLGGGGPDSLTGGAGQDYFLFTQLEVTTVTTDRIDQITDFEIGADKIDLTGFVEQLSIVEEFTDEAFQVTLTDTETGTTVRIDVDGDGVFDLEIRVTTANSGPLTSDDFVL